MVHKNRKQFFLFGHSINFKKFNSLEITVLDLFKSGITKNVIPPKLERLGDNSRIENLVELLFQKSVDLSFLARRPWLGVRFRDSVFNPPLPLKKLG